MDQLFRFNMVLSSSDQNYINKQGLFWNSKEDHQSLTIDFYFAFNICCVMGLYNTTLNAVQRQNNQNRW